MAWNTKIPARLIDFGNKVLPDSETCIGVRLVSSGGGSGSWLRVDEYDNVVDVSSTYFDNHPIYSNMTQVQLDGTQIFVKVPKFYIRTYNGTSFWISTTKKEGFRLHPAFLKVVDKKLNEDGSITETIGEAEYFLVGAYQAYVTGGGLCCTESDVFPTVYTSFNEYKVACDARNSDTNGVSGYHMINVYELSALQILALIELCTTDVQSKLGVGRVNADGMDVTNATDVITGAYRGVYGLWGNAWQYVDGLKTDEECNVCVWGFDGKKVYQNTSIKLPSKILPSNDWVEGKTLGYYKSLNTNIGVNYNLGDIFLPDTTTLTDNYNDGTFSDYVICRSKQDNESIAVE